MDSLLPLRDKLLRGDTRPLYLGWLARLGNEELGDDDIEPPMPAGLQTLTPAQTALTEFLLIDPDRLAAAAGASPALPDRDTMDPELDDWLALQTREAMQATLRLLLRTQPGSGAHVAAALSDLAARTFSRPAIFSAAHGCRNRRRSSNGEGPAS